MKSIAALLLTIALALFPLSGTGAMAAVAAHAHAALQGSDLHEHGAGDHHGLSAARAEATVLGSPARMDNHGQQDASEIPCAGDQASSNCCSLSCHAMAPHVGIGVPAQGYIAVLVDPVALPLPCGLGFDGLLRPPRPA